ncbi:hypothetical protein MDMS009_1361 [Methylophaga thiooxydans DMS010]|uniref:Uncharacterized protein n=1 Tax=Methylophaga thiooxydans DMS010 TaxID=637616 RepID=C0N5N5_9GAMM|nr:hypothetical protein MDMS009_1361 [Methylophaga thiooxydans DMS010]
MSVASLCPRHKMKLIFRNKAISGAFLFGSFILGQTQIRLERIWTPEVLEE